MTRRIRFCSCIAAFLVLLAGASAQTIHTVAGGGPDHIAATSASLPQPFGGAVDASGNLYFTNNDALFKVDTTGLLTRLAGTHGVYGYAGDGGPAAKALFQSPWGVALDAAGNLYIADSNNHRIRAVNMQANSITLLGVLIAPGDIATVAGNGAGGSGATRE